MCEHLVYLDMATGQCLEYTHVSKREYMKKRLCVELWKKPKALRNLHNLYFLPYWVGAKIRVEYKQLVDFADARSLCK